MTGHRLLAASVERPRTFVSSRERTGAVALAVFIVAAVSGVMP